MRTAGLPPTWQRDSHTIVIEPDVSPPPALLPAATTLSPQEYGQPLEWEPHSHPVSQLLSVQRGIMKLVVERSAWVVPPHFAVWVPAGTLHTSRTSAHCEFQATFFSERESFLRPREAYGVSITPLLFELLARLRAVDLTQVQRRNIERVLFDNLSPASHDLRVRMPRDWRILPIADALTAEPGDRRSLDDWAESLEFSSKTLARIFQNETGISFHSWRQLVRVQSALEQLSNGASVALVARSLGYAQTSTFIDAFRRVLNVTPGQYRAHALAA